MRVLSLCISLVSRFVRALSLLYVAMMCCEKFESLIDRARGGFEGSLLSLFGAITFT